MSIFSEIQQLFPDKSLQEIAKELNYPESTICVLSGNEQEVSSKYPEIYNVILQRACAPTSQQGHTAYTE